MLQSCTSSKLALPSISEQIWDAKYRLKTADGTPVDQTIDDTWERVARAAAAMEAPGARTRWQTLFFAAMSDLAFLPAGRIIAGAGSGREVTLHNCFVMGRIEDDLTSIFDNVKEAALTMQRGGGIGHDFSTLRPSGALVRSVGAGASGPVSFMDVWDAMCRTIMSAGQRRGAMMGTLRCDHPDIEAFVDAKRDARRLRNFNLSVLVTDAFMAAVRADAPWELQFGGKVVRTVPARGLWERITRATYDSAEPGVIFIDRINARNNLAYCESIQATNPCGEQPLPPYGACLLGSINLARLVVQPFTPHATMDEARLAQCAALAVRFLDDIIDISAYPLPAQRREALAKRRLGLGLTGLADALAMLGVRYGTPDAARLAGRWMAVIERHAYLASAELASEKGPFPLYESGPFLGSPNVARLDADVRAAIGRHGIRNGCLTSVAPTGTISLLAGNVSSGIEPIFDIHYRRRIRETGDTFREELVEDYAYRLFRSGAGQDAALPTSFITANELSPLEHLEMQAAVQAHVDSSISKTINCPETMPFEAFKDIYSLAYQLGLKGCTTFRPNPVTGSVLAGASAATAAISAAVTGSMPSQTASGATHAGVSPLPPSSIESERSGAGTGSPTPVADRAGAPAGPLPAAASGAMVMGAPPAGGKVGAPSERPGIVYMSRPLERDPVLAGFTYKLKWASSDHAIYITINDIERDGRRRPFEIFINTKNLEHYAWTVALTRMISAVFRRGGDVSFVVEELKAVFDPQGGQWMEGRYVPSLLAAIGGVIEHHLVAIGFLQEPLPSAAPTSEPVQPMSGDGVPRWPEARARRCPRCSSGAMVLQAGCWLCRDCGYSRCG
ncbi:MAG: adenosylcobalamin-dependent ribonucleoside-diphosphate reductase [Hyphomicrobiaceae bacterium]|nr:adenosylcobalamin-dependent ribonucleoside-diphosphate reductase [Hyphomicrobiaceae bacterium]